MTEQLVLKPPPERHQATNLATIEAWLQDRPLWLDGYLYLRAKGVRYRDAMLAVWLSLGKDDRGDVKTRADFANLLGISRATTYHWETHRPIQRWAEALLLIRLRGSRLAEVDEATYDAAIAETGAAGDRRLYYQRARVLEETTRLLFDEAQDPLDFEDISDDELEAVEAALIEQTQSRSPQK